MSQERKRKKDEHVREACIFCLNSVRERFIFLDKEGNEEIGIYEVPASHTFCENQSNEIKQHQLKRNVPHFKREIEPAIEQIKKSGIENKYLNDSELYEALDLIFRAMYARNLFPFNQNR